MAVSVKLRPASNRFEQEVFDYLVTHLPDEYLVTTSFAIPGDGREVDGLVIGPNGVFTIEAKGIRGHVAKGANTSLRITGTGGIQTDFSDRAEYPSVQAESQAKRLRSFLTNRVGIDCWVKPLLVFPSGSTFNVPPENRDVTWFRFAPFIVSLDEAPVFIRGFRSPRGEHISQKTRDVIVRAIREGPKAVPERDRLSASRDTARRDDGFSQRLRPVKGNVAFHRAIVWPVLLVMMAVTLIFVLGVFAYVALGFGLKPAFPRIHPGARAETQVTAVSERGATSTATATAQSTATLDAFASAQKTQLAAYQSFRQGEMAVPNRTPVRTQVPAGDTSPPSPAPTVTEAPSATAPSPAAPTTITVNESVPSPDTWLYGDGTLTLQRILLRPDGIVTFWSLENRSADRAMSLWCQTLQGIDNLGNTYELPFVDITTIDSAPGSTAEGACRFVTPAYPDADNLFLSVRMPFAASFKVPLP